MRTEVKRIKVADYVELYNNLHEDKITRHHVYKMIKEGKLSAEKDAKGYWIITLREEKKNVKEYSPAEFVERYNRRHPKNPITVKKIRELAEDGKIKAKKESRKWIIMENPAKLIK